ncbi:unnamed protein product [Arctogadus glacialis]
MLTEEEEEAPSITEFHSSTHVLPVGQKARYTCHASGTPEPTVEWLHNGRPLERDGTDDQSEAWVERGFLFVRGGRYGVNTVCCMASNSAGTANHTAELLVFDACELTLDPNTAHRDLSLSEDNRKVTVVGEDQSYPDHPERFDYWAQVLGREALTVTGRVGVYLDRPAGSLSFYRVSPGGGGSSDTLTHLHTFWSSFTQEDLLPGFWKLWSTDISLKQYKQDHPQRQSNHHQYPLLKRRQPCQSYLGIFSKQQRNSKPNHSPKLLRKRFPYTKQLIAFMWMVILFSGGK